MTELNLFKIEPDFVPIGKENEFYDITDEIFEGKINSEVIISDVTRKVLKVMVCKQSWINKYYEEPLKEYEEQSKKEKEENKETKYSHYFKNECTCCACSCDCCCNYNCDACVEETCCCCGCRCPGIYICGSNLCCGEKCSCYCCREATGVIFWIMVFSGCLFSPILYCLSACF